MSPPPDAFDLTGRVAVVTGGSRGLGRQMVLAFAAHGADVAIASRKVDACEALAAEVREATGRRALAVGCHVGRWEECDALVERVEAELGPIRVLVNNAGMSPLYPSLPEVSEDLFDKVLAVNLKGPFRLAALVGARMAAGAGGSIINVSSVASIQPAPVELPYAAAKAGLNALDGRAGPRVRAQGAREHPDARAVPHRHLEGVGPGGVRGDRSPLHPARAGRPARGGRRRRALPRQRRVLLHDGRDHQDRWRRGLGRSMIGGVTQRTEPARAAESGGVGPSGRERGVVSVPSDDVMPAVFFGHGTPMNALETNRYTEAWSAFGASVPRPRAILSISAHWFINASAVTAMAAPRTIHDFFGFPDELFALQYPAPGDPDLAGAVQRAADPVWIGRDEDSWGLDHGTWSVLVHAFPAADVPVVQLALDGTKPLQYHLELGARLAPLREEGVLIMASGNTVHHLGRLDWSRPDAGYDWAVRFGGAVADRLLDGDPAAVARLDADPDFALAAPTPDHFLPVLYLAGLAMAAGEHCAPLVEGFAFGSLSMDSFTLGAPAA